MVNTRFDVKIKRFQLDNANDYFNQTLSPFFKIKRLFMNPRVTTLQQNEVAE